MRLSILYSPTCVGLRYGRPRQHAAAFLGRLFKDFASAEASTRGLAASCHYQPAGPLHGGVPTTLRLSRCRNIRLLSIAYALRPRLRSRLTLGRTTLPRKPWVYGGQESHLPFRYSCLHSLLAALHLRSPSGFAALTMLLYHSRLQMETEVQSFGMPLIANYFRRRISR